MASKTKSKIAICIVVFTAAVIFFFMLILAFTITTLRGTVNENIYSMEAAFQRKSDLQTVQVSFEKLKRYEEGLFWKNESAENIGINISDNISRINNSLYDYRTYRAPEITVSEEAGLLDLTELFAEYNDRLIKLAEDAKGGNRGNSENLSPDAILLRDEITAKIQELVDVNCAYADELIRECENKGNRALFLLIAVGGASVIILALLSVFVLLAVNTVLTQTQMAAGKS